MLSYLNHYSRWLVLCLSLALFACGGGGGSSDASSGINNSEQSIAATPETGNNVLPIVVNAGLTNIINRPYTSVTLCKPSTTNCITVDNILVDTGSVGLRMMQSSALSALGLPVQSVGANTLMNCAQFLDNTNVWGSVRLADVTLGSLTASAIPIQVIADPSAPYTVPSTCGTASYSMVTAGGSGRTSLGANGILGIGINTEDCGSACSYGNHPGWYYTCPGNVCAPVSIPVSNQLQHPVAHFPTDNNGLVVVFPDVPSGGAQNVAGFILFGVGTESNNPLGSSTLLQTSIGNSGHITATVSSPSISYGPTSMVNSFPDTGSNGLMFGSGSGYPAMLVTGSWYTPTAPVSLSAAITGSNNLAKSFAFVIADNTYNNSFAQPTRGGPSGSNQMFDLGLPFYYGRSVFLGIEGMQATRGGQTVTGPFYAF